MNKICICCTSENIQMVSMKTCKHARFLKNYVKYKFNSRNTYICVICHNMLKRIELFKLQVEESIALLNKQTHILKLNKLHSLQYSTLQTTSSTDPIVKVKVRVIQDLEKVDSEVTDFDAETDIKIEHESSNSESEVPLSNAQKIEVIQKVDLEKVNYVSDFDAETDVKIEHDSSDSESEVPLSKVQKRKKYIDRYEGKIRVLKLSLEELQTEREAMAKEDKYLKLPYKCEYCVVGFDHDVTLKNHKEKRHTKTKNSFQCDICTSVLNTKPSFNEHKKRHYVRYECLDCGKRYIQDHSAIQHYNENHLPEGSSLSRIFTCRHCGFTTNRNRSYRYHVSKHSKKNECSLCGNVFVTSASLKTHLFTIHKQSSRVYSCAACDKTYRQRSGLCAHARRAHATRAPDAYCATCRTHYVTEHALKTHLNTHSKHVSDTDKRYICDECGVKFVRKYSLQVHINWEHLRTSTHTCVKCSKLFKTNKDLRRHISYVHNKQRPPRDKICHFCGRGFFTQTILRSHLRTHTGERPLQCEHCKSTFAHSGALYTHIKLKHNGLNK